MALNYDYNSLKVETTGQTVYVPNNDLARLMYYLDCVLAVIQYEEDSRLTDYQNYLRLTEEEKKAVYALAALFQPKIFIDAGVFLPKPSLVPYGKSNQFYKITDDRIGIHVNQEIVIGGRVVRVLEVMAFTQEWLNRNYIEPLENITYRLESQQNRYISPPPANIYVNQPVVRQDNCCDSYVCGNCTWKQCCCWFVIIVVVLSIIEATSNSTSTW